MFLVRYSKWQRRADEWVPEAFVQPWSEQATSRRLPLAAVHGALAAGEQRGRGSLDAHALTDHIAWSRSDAVACKV